MTVTLLLLYHSNLFPSQGFYNLELACHVSITLGAGSLRYVPVTNIIIDSGQMSCSCVVVSTSPGNRHESFNCFLFRARCPVTHNLGVVVAAS